MYCCQINGNVAVFKGQFLELPSGHVIIITVYTQVFTSAVSSLMHLVLTYISLSTIVSLCTH